MSRSTYRSEASIKTKTKTWGLARARPFCRLASPQQDLSCFVSEDSASSGKLGAAPPPPVSSGCHGRVYYFLVELQPPPQPSAVGVGASPFTYY